MFAGRRRPLGLLLLTVAAALAVPAGAGAATSGGLEAGATTSTRASGGTTFGSGSRAASRPTAEAFRVAPTRVVSGGALPAIQVRFQQPGVRSVKARMVVVPVRGPGTVVRLDLGTVRTGRTLRPTWPANTRLAEGRYVARVHAVDATGHQLKRTRKASGRSLLTVVAAPTPKPAPAPVLAPVTPAGSPGTFPVAGPHTYGEGFGTDRGDHSHQGVDLLAAQGLANVAPTAGTIRFTSYQEGGAGEYVVMRSVTGPDYFLAHCVRGSTRVKADQQVSEGQPLCAVGSTGRSSATHLHFEIWPNGWRTGAKDSVPVDPLAQLKAWDR